MWNQRTSVFKPAQSLTSCASQGKSWISWNLSWLRRSISRCHSLWNWALHFSPAKHPWYFPKLPRAIWRTCHHLTCPHPPQTFHLPERRAWGWRASTCQFLSWKWGDTVGFLWLQGLWTPERPQGRGEGLHREESPGLQVGCQQWWKPQGRLHTGSAWVDTALAQTLVHADLGGLGWGHSIPRLLSVFLSSQGPKLQPSLQPLLQSPSQTPEYSSGLSIWNNLYSLVWRLCIAEPNDCFYLILRCLIIVEHFNTIKLKQATSSLLIVAWHPSQWRLQQYQTFNSYHTFC